MSGYGTKKHIFNDEKWKKIQNVCKRKNVYLSSICTTLQIDSYILYDWAEAHKKVRDLVQVYLDKPGRNSPVVYDEDKHPALVYKHLASMGTRIGAAGVCGISYVTLMHWYHDYKSMQMSYDSGFAAGTACIDELSRKQALRLDHGADVTMIKSIVHRRQGDLIRKSLIGKNVAESLRNCMERYQEDHGVMDSQQSKGFIDIIQAVAQMEDLEGLKRQLQELKDNREDK